jgi:nitrogen fixation protein FixH
MNRTAFKAFTGWHMTAIMVTFFVIVMGVNFLMARYAVGTFGGTVVDNSYVASQQYNKWLAEGRRQDALGWGVTVSLDRERHVIMTLNRKSGGNAEPLVGAQIKLRATHPLGRFPADDLAFNSMAAGQYRSVRALPQGRWNCHVEIRLGDDILKQKASLQ